MAKNAAAAGHLVSARDNYFAAAACYLMTQMLVPEGNLTDMTAYNVKKNECYDSFIEYAP